MLVSGLLSERGPFGLSGFRGVRKKGGHKRNRPFQVLFSHQGKQQTFSCFATAEEAAWEQDLRRLELGYEDGLLQQLGQVDGRGM